MASRRCAPVRERAVFPFIARFALAASAVVLAPVPAAAQTPLTLAQAQRIALAQSRQLPARDLAAMAARDMAIAASQLPDPVLKAGVDNVPVNGSDRFRLNAESMTMRRVGIMQELTRGEKRRLRAERFEREGDLALAEKTVAVATIERASALAWLDRYYAETMASVVTLQQEQAQRELAAAEAAFRAGRGSQADVLSARAAVAQFADRVDDAGRRVRSAKIALARWIGDSANQPLADRPPIDTIRLDADSLDTQLAHHPEIAVLNRQVDAAATEAKLAEANKKADWTVEVGYAQRAPAYSNMISFGVSLPLQWDQKNRQNRELAAKLATVEKTRAERDETLRAHTAETRVMVAEWQANRERLARYSRELVPLAQGRSQAVVAAYRGGKASLSEVLAARRVELEVRLSGLQLEAETARLWAQLNFLFPTSQSTVPAPPSVTRSTK
ncbi:TolC family protein [Massilia sp. G4R7]|uniref:TolC family protein n=1 Tax=Massilia phyllostachyos TaxID=2898585 RepID=A0ABS8Q7Y3_9BURK|nr:TolC family protein [Massilia phyllostachyos]MCD2516725.1 TolC family protein [Massilia phyllostachyos]